VTAGPGASGTAGSPADSVRPAVPVAGSAVPRLVVVTDRRQAERAGRSLVEVVAAAVSAGAGAVLLREKDLPPAARRSLAAELRAVLAPAGGRLIVSGDVGLARRSGAGVHLSATDPWPAAGPRSAAGPGAGVGPQVALVGRSCHTVDELREARARGAGYATLSPVFPSPSKPGYGPAVGLDGLAAACAAVPDLPVVALGGIGPGTAAPCLAAGARGVAVMGAVMGAGDPAAVVRTLLAELGATASSGPTGSATVRPVAGAGR
jgi:thiamine-phosphate pyrophosphorylase